jgi:hypothetical protein
VRRRAGLALLLLVVAGCRLELALDVEMAEDGSGTVEVVTRVDPDGIERIGGDLAAVLEVDDVEQAGWIVEGPSVDDDGFTSVRFRQPFDTPSEANAILEQVAAADGPFQGLAVRRESGFARTEWGFTGALDTSGGIESFGDDALAAELDGQPLGQTVEEIEADLGEPLRNVIRLRVSVTLPGEVSGNGSSVGDATEWDAAFGDPAIEMSATGEERRTASVIGVAVAVGCGVLLVVYATIGLVRRRRSSHRPAHISNDEAS